jgi:hypothetical protein
MENRDSEPGPAGIDLAATGFSTAARNIQAFAEEFGRVSRTSFAQNTKLIDDLRSARDIEDVFAIQTKFMTDMFEAFNEHVRLMMSHMADVPAGMPKSAESFSATVPSPMRAAEKASEAMDEARPEPQANGATEAPSDAYAGSETGANAPPSEQAAARTTDGAGEIAMDADTAAPMVTPATTALHASFVVGEELAKAELAAAEEAEQSVAEATEWAVKASRDAWEELAKAAAELLKGEPEPKEPDSEA